MLGISVYPYKEDVKKTKKYIEKANSYGFKRIFLNLLLFDESKINDFVKSNKEIISFSKNLNMEVYVDVNPEIFKILNVDYNNLKFFKDLGVDGIRLDNVFNGDVEADLTYNEHNLKIELNASQNTEYISNIFTKKPNYKNLITCHNFYPQKYSGLSEDFFVKTTSISKKHGLRTAAFITSQNKNTHGPHEVDDKLPTLEMHRNMPINVQLKHLIALGNIDDVIISNAYASDDELEKVLRAYKPYIVFDVKKIREYLDTEVKILNELHKNRGDIGDFLIRSSIGRVKYSKEEIKNVQNKKVDIKRGTVYIANENFGQYKGELAIALKDVEIDKDLVNVIGYINKDEMFLLDYLKEYSRFKINII